MAELAASSRISPRRGPGLVGKSLFAPTPASPFRRASLVHLLHRLTVAAAVVVLVVAMALVVFRNRYDGKVMPSIVVADVAVGGLSRQDAEAAVLQRADTLLNTPLTFSYQSLTWNPTLAQLGVVSDPTRSVDSAYAIGRESGARERLVSSFDVSRDSHYVPLAMSIDPAAAETWANTITDDLGLAPRDATIELDGAEVTLHPDIDGIVVDAERLGAIIDESVATLTPYDGPLPIRAVPAAIQTSDLQEDATLLEEAMSKPIAVVHKKKKWTLQPADIGQFVEQRAQEGGPGITVDVDRDALSDWLRVLISESINRDARDAVVAWNGDRLGVVEESSDGLRIRPDSLAQEVVESFFGDHDSVPIPVRVIKPAIDSDRLEDLKIDQELGRGTSNFAGSDYGRSTNVIVGTEQLNGAMVPPGGDFSFNDSIGDITADRGYVESNVVDGERIGKDIGGGICQVSTTVFRAAYVAGMPMVEWNPHLYRLSFYESDGYPPGLDASILQEGPRENWGDFRFNNPTDGWLLIESYVVDVQVVVVIYGPETNWQISFAEPYISDEADGLKKEDHDALEIVDPELEPGTIQQSEWAIDGLEVLHHRVVKDEDGAVISDREFYTRFAARGDVYKVSPDMQGESPASDPENDADEESDEQSAP